MTSQPQRPHQRTPRRRSAHIAAQVRNTCGTSAAQVRHNKCGATSAAQVRHKCGTSAAQVRHKFGASSEQVRSKCGASAEQVRSKCGAQCGSRAERRRMCGAASSGKNTPPKAQKHAQKHKARCDNCHVLFGASSSSMASPTSTHSMTVRQSLDWPLWSGHFPASSVRRKGSSGLVVGHAEAGAVYV